MQGSVQGTKAWAVYNPKISGLQRMSLEGDPVNSQKVDASNKPETSDRGCGGERGRVRGRCGGGSKEMDGFPGIPGPPIFSSLNTHGEKLLKRAEGSSRRGGLGLAV